MKSRNRIGSPGKAQGKNGHTKQLFRVARVLPAEAKQALLGEPQRFAQRTKVFFYEFGIKAIVTGWNGSVGCKNNLAGNSRHSGIESDSLFLHSLVNGL